MIADVARLLACPVCRRDLELVTGSLRCADGHTFDVARQGYVNLLPGGARPGTADTADMVTARAAFLGAGHYDAIADAVAARVVHAVASTAGAVVDVGAGTGHYLAHALPDGTDGLALDLSVPAARLAARSHPRVGAVVCDVWQDLPVRDGVAAAVLDVFAPRNPAEMRRVLRPGGHLVVVTPRSDHLAELVAPLGLVHVDETKNERLRSALDGYLDPVDGEDVTVALTLTRDDVEALVRMGPSARHVDAAHVTRSLPATVEATAAVRVASYRRPPDR